MLVRTYGVRKKNETKWNAIVGILDYIGIHPSRWNALCFVVWCLLLDEVSGSFVVQPAQDKHLGRSRAGQHRGVLWGRGQRRTYHSSQPRRCFSYSNQKKSRPGRTPPPTPPTPLLQYCTVLYCLPKPITNNYQQHWKQQQHHLHRRPP